MNAPRSRTAGAPSPSRTPSPDPIFALIDAHRTAIDVLEALPMDGPETKAAEIGERAIFDALLATRPATLAGAAAFCRYAADESPSLATYAPDHGAPLAIRMLAEALATLHAMEPRSIAPDAGLKVLAGHLEQAWIEEREASAQDARDGTERATETAVGVSSVIVDRILATRATTLEGLRIKARAILWCSSGDMEEALDQDRPMATNEQLAWSIVADLLRDQPPAPPPVAVTP